MSTDKILFSAIGIVLLVSLCMVAGCIMEKTGWPFWKAMLPILTLMICLGLSIAITFLVVWKLGGLK